MKRILTLVLVLVLALCCITACKTNKPEPELTPVSLTIKSLKEVSIEVGQAYTLTYETDGAVNVTVSGGTYDKDSQKFSATEPGTYTITVTATAEGKKDTVATVTVTVTAASADKTALITAITGASALKKGDYTSATWSALDTALKAANTARNQAGISQTDVDSAAAALAKAITDLQPVEIAKAVVAEDESSFTYNSTTYKAEDFNNFEAIVAEIKTLNAKTEIVLKSAYTTAIDAILATLDAKVKLVIKSDLRNNTTMLVETLGTYTLTAESEDGVTFAWTVNNEAKSSEATLEFTPAAFETEYVIKCTVTKGENTNVKTLKVSFREVDYKVNNIFASGITVENNVITVNSNCSWGEEEGKKVTLPDVRLSGDFTVYFDVTFTTHEDVGVMAMFLLKENGERNDFWVAVLQHSNKLEVATRGDNDIYKPRYDMPVGTADLDKVVHVMMTRTITDGKAYLYAYLLDDAGNVIMEHKADGLYKNDADSLGTVQLGIQAENAHFAVSNIAVGIEDSVVNVKALEAYLDTLPDLIESDYTAESWATYVNAQQAAKSAKSQAELAEKITAIGTAKDALVPAEIIKPVIAENNNITFGGTAYEAAQYANIDDIIKEINALDETLNSVYASKVEAILAKLVTKISVDVNWDGLDAHDGRTIFVSTLPECELYATPSEGVTVTWYVNGEVAKEGKSFDFKPTYGDYTVTCKATKDIYIVEKTVKVGFANPNYAIHKDFEAGITVANDVITVSQSYGWGAQEGKKVIMSNVAVDGEFTVYFDVKFTDGNGVMALFFHKEDGFFMDEWIAICQHSNKLEVAVNNNKPQVNMFVREGVDDNAQIALGTTVHVKAVRTIVDNKSFYKAYILDDEGNVIATNENNTTGEDYTGAIMFGVQSENCMFEVSNIQLDFGAHVANKNAVQEELAKIASYTISDYTEESWQAVLDAKALADAANTQALADAATLALKNAFEGLTPATFEKAVVSETAISYAGRTYDAADYSNYDTVLATVNELAELTLRSEYNPEIVKALASLEFKLKFSVSGLADGTNAIVKALTEYTFNASSETDGVTYSWYVDGEKKADGAEFKFTPDGFDAYEITCKAVDADGAKAHKIIVVSFIESDVKTPMDDRVTVHDDGSFSSVTGIGWGDWEGRKVLYDDLVFNGSFSITMDLTIGEKGGGANVATIHLLNADTLSPSFGGDWAFVGYGCICLHENPVRLESNWNGTGKKQSSDGGFEAVAAKMTEAASLLETGSFTVKLTCYRNERRQLQLVYALWNGTEWIEFNRNEWAGDMGGGFIVGINIENVGITAKNVRYELLEATGSYVAGSVKSRAALSAALVQYKNLDVSQYVNPTEFIVARDAAWAAMADNSVNANYDAAAADLKEAAKALVERTVAVSAGALDKGYANYRGVDKFTATFADDIEATEIKWTYKLNGEEKTAEGADLALEVGAYTDVVLSFKVGEETYSYTYQNFSVAAIGLKSNTDRVTLNEDGSVKVDDGAGWGQKDQLVIDGCRTQEFELVFNAKYDGTPGGAYRVMCINLFGEDIRPVFGYQREDQGNRAQLGFDSNGQWNNINNTDAEDEPYDYIYGESGAKFSLKLTQDGEGKSTITFTVYAADGSVIATMSCDYSKWYNSTTDIRFTFENIDLTLSDFEVYYN